MVRLWRPQLSIQPLGGYAGSRERLCEDTLW